MVADLRTRVAAQPQWYHTLDLADGVTTPGWFDLRGLHEAVRFPRELAGLRCLDVATFDGFWAFSMEARGAGEVQAIDLLDEREWDWPAGAGPGTVTALARRKSAGAGFEIAREALGSRVQRRDLSVYDLAPEAVGTFDFVYIGSLLLHLRDPIRALEAVRSVCRGRMLLVDAIHLPNSLRRPRTPVATFDGIGRPWWWKPNRAALVRMVRSAGFRPVTSPRMVMLPPGPGQNRVPPRRLLRAMGHPESRSVAFRTWWGDPHLAVLSEVEP